MSALRGLLLAVLLCAATDTALTRAEHAHRAPEGLLPLQTLALWGALALLASPPTVWLARRTGAGFSSALMLLGGPVGLHGVLAEQRRAGALSLEQSWPIALLTLAALLLFLLIGGRLERRASPRLRRALTLALLLGALVALVPHDGGWTRPPAPAVAGRAPSGTDDGRPNLLLLVWDTTRADRLAPWGHDRVTTPQLDALAERSRLFENAWSASLFTLSSHASMLTGLPVSLHGTTLHRQQLRAPSVAQILSEAGWRTGAFVGTSVLAAGRGLERGFDRYDDLVDPPVTETRLWALVNDLQVLAAKLVPALRFDGQPHWFQDFQRPADEVLAAARTFIEADDGRPWFVLVNLFDAHWPYLPGEDACRRFVRPYHGLFGGHTDQADDWEQGRRPDEADKRHVRDLYDAELYELDAAVGAFLAALPGPAERTAIVVTSDHGEALGERDLWSHEELHAPQSHVPLLIHAPGRVSRGRVGQAVSGIDIAPTLLALAGVAPPEGVRMTGLSLLDDALPDERLIFVQDHDNVKRAKDGDAVIFGRHKLLAARGSVSLHDLHADPLDEHDLSAEQPRLRAELEQALAVLRAAETQAGGGGLDNLDALRALGYTGN